jgi:hypothetical protein
VIDDSESRVVVEVDTNYFDPAPTLVINGQRIATARALRWYQWMWMLVSVSAIALAYILPVVLVLVYREVVGR